MNSKKETDINGEDDDEDNGPIQAAVDIIVDNMPHEWKEIGHRLQLTKSYISKTGQKFEGDPKQCCREVLWQWRVKNRGKATCEQLQKIVSDCGHKDVSEKMQKNCFFKEKHSARQDPMDAATLQILRKSIPDEKVTFLEELLRSPECQGDKESKEKFEQRMDLRKKTRAVVDSIMINIAKDLWLELDKIDKEQGEELNGLEMALESESENNKAGPYEDIQTKSRQKNKDSGFPESSAPQSYSSPHRSLARDENEVHSVRVSVNDKVELKIESENFSCNEASEGLSSSHVGGLQTASPIAIQVVCVKSPGNYILNDVSGSTFNSYNDVPQENPGDRGDRKEPPDTTN